MSNIENQTDNDKKFSGRSLAAAGAILGVGVTAWAGGTAAHHNDAEAYAAELSKATTEQNETYYETIENAVNADYDSSALVGNIDVSQGDSLGGLGEGLVIDALGDDIYNDIKSRIYNPLYDSAKLHNSQPGDTYSLVETDLDPEADNGNEYIVVEPTHIVHPSVTELATPTIELTDNK